MAVRERSTRKATGTDRAIQQAVAQAVRVIEALPPEKQNSAYTGVLREASDLPALIAIREKQTEQERGAAQRVLKRDKREHALQVLDPALRKLAAVRDLLTDVENGKHCDFTEDTLATLSRAALNEAATELEQALFDLGLLKIDDSDRRFGGWFVQAFTI